MLYFSLFSLLVWKLRSVHQWCLLVLIEGVTNRSKPYFKVVTYLTIDMVDDSLCLQFSYVVHLSFFGYIKKWNTSFYIGDLGRWCFQILMSYSRIRSFAMDIADYLKTGAGELCSHIQVSFLFVFILFIYLTVHGDCKICAYRWCFYSWWLIKKWLPYTAPHIGKVLKIACPFTFPPLLPLFLAIPFLGLNLGLFSFGLTSSMKLMGFVFYRWVRVRVRARARAETFSWDCFHSQYLNNMQSFE